MDYILSFSISVSQQVHAHISVSSLPAWLEKKNFPSFWFKEWVEQNRAKKNKKKKKSQWNSSLWNSSSIGKNIAISQPKQSNLLIIWLSHQQWLIKQTRVQDLWLLIDPRLHTAKSATVRSLIVWGQRNAILHARKIYIKEQLIGII